jgi:hypothetical protein
VGETARWVGKLYLSIMQENPSAPLTVVMSDIIKFRYAAKSSESTKDALLSHVESGESRGLAHLVTNILTVEAGFQENTQKHRFQFMKLIQEELQKFGIPEKIIYDDRI